MMLLRNLKNLIKKNDLFYSNEMLRYENQMEYKSLTGGIISLALIITILVGFANMIILTLQREQISSNKLVQKQSDPPLMSVKVSPDNKFMIGFQIQGIDLLAQTRYFNFRFMKVTRQGGNLVQNIKVPYQRCTKQHWSSFPQAIDNFDALGIENWVCPKIGYNLDLQGKYSSSKSIQYVYTVQECRNSSTQSTCASKQSINSLFQQASKQFFLTVYYINPIINENKRDYVSYYLQDSNYIIFGDKVGSQAYFYFSDYTVQTDESIWPFDSIVEETGSLIQNFWSMPYQVSEDGQYGGLYAYIRLVKSSSSITYVRQVQKISAILSFIGGMISAVSAALFIIKQYNTQAFEIQIASSIFTDSLEREQLKKNNFFTFLKYNVYKFIQFLGCCNSDQNYNLLQRCLQQMGKQLDIKSLIQRIIFLQHCLSFLLEDYQLTSIQVKRPSSCEAIKKVRQQCYQTEDEIHDIALSNQTQVKNPNQNFSSVRNIEIKVIPEKSSQRIIRQKPSLNSNMQNIFIDEIIQELPQRQKKGTNRIADCSLFLKKQRSSLLILQQNAHKGDRISLKIYNHLNKQVKQSIFKKKK